MALCFIVNTTLLSRVQTNSPWSGKVVSVFKSELSDSCRLDLVHFIRNGSFTTYISQYRVDNQ
ncbi:hypothetical protein CCR75_004674 [Bremia lactucae]|uniref:Uncharacterized protein n=1 Tax=Bremia lactucae TaxID=4779 RepID=A0A976IGM6_BRELC|nr:hypothetical protein CCR75_004671 [Bremia lactucae]TDH71071.1 hypothetical protein CCR75_004674 [Bremia lactucae]